VRNSESGGAQSGTRAAGRRQMRGCNQPAPDCARRDEFPQLRTPAGTVLW